MGLTKNNSCISTIFHINEYDNVFKCGIIMFLWCVDSLDDFDTAKKNTSTGRMQKGVQDEEASSDKQMFCLLHYVLV